MSGEIAWGGGGETSNGFDVGYSNDARNHEGGNDAGGFDSGGAGGGCFNCGQEGHMKAECPEPRKGGENSGLCYNCGQEGHNKTDCPNEAVAKEFTGTCRICEQEGHRASGCPTAPPRVCKNCEQEGHGINECKNPRKVDRSHIEDIDPELAWNALVKAVEERDIDDLKEAVEKYLKSHPEITYTEFESSFRALSIPVYIIAMEKELADTYTNMDLQGNLGKKYTVSYRFSDKPRRPKEKEGWPTAEENMERLKDAGEPVDVRMPKCSNCGQLGHINKSCTEDKVEVERTQVMCKNCDQLGHRNRDCPEPRPERHIMLCRNCNQTGHKSADCTNEKVLICKNCDAEGHVSRDCKEKKDWSRVKCSNCEQMGHSKVKCKEPIKEEEGAPAGDGYGDEAGGGFGADTGGDAAGESWNTSAPAAEADAGDNMGW